ncbi:TSUP family transporter [Bradyrhizobium manausense]|uniref:TSUP family transporter n=1 Tax=Bradyrhizobium TaxID=374 RepID=UPI001BA6B3AC|nr:MULTISPECIES: TSUP family transporter [Bradyrhizobium]MBR0828988.1 TSUP family transporter [Bradyrhizobium manausense]UVO28007.1 TSUP family transporter [Bradyrhizobium arachidis]
MISMPFAAALAASVLSTSFVSGLFGMAGGMILMSLLLYLMPVAPAMVLHGITQIAANLARAWNLRQHIVRPVVVRYTAGALLAGVIVASGLVAPSKPVALIFIGLTSFAGLALPHRLTPNVTAPSQAIGCGTLCTGLQLISGVSGPILDLFFVRTALGRKEIIATKAAIQSIGHVLKLIYFGRLLLIEDGGISPLAVLLAIAAAVLGTLLSRGLLDALTDIGFALWSRRLIAAAAAVSLAQGLVLEFGSFR